MVLNHIYTADGTCERMCSSGSWPSVCHRGFGSIPKHQTRANVSFSAGISEELSVYILLEMHPSDCQLILNLTSNYFLWLLNPWGWKWALMAPAIKAKLLTWKLMWSWFCNSVSRITERMLCLDPNLLTTNSKGWDKDFQEVWVSRHYPPKSLLHMSITHFKNKKFRSEIITGGTGKIFRDHGNISFCIKLTDIRICMTLRSHLNHFVVNIATR